MPLHPQRRAGSARDADRDDGTVQPFASWLQVWNRSAILPAPLLVDFGPLLAAVLLATAPAAPPRAPPP
ncbi:hypothetical protein [Streptomyces sp. CC224B]|uniref:hypothetical protein n=1 Tax=Streptomyces sp. CC224B TaxID=3044571 RepID=UPI0024A8AFCE|nr:hypothetical protein [Streptomyces sp. CC224B]